MCRTPRRTVAADVFESLMAAVVEIDRLGVAADDVD
jgi:hypothetical protein